ncbi:MAG: HAD family hydrolase [Methanomassiliicoccales archaeon]
MVQGRFDLVAFDMDGVLVECESSWSWVHDHFGVDNDTALMEFLRGEIDDREFMRRDIALWKAARPDLDLDHVHRILEPVPVTKGVRETVSTLRGAGTRTVIISGGIDLVAGRIAEDYGFDDFLANGLECDGGGRLTGEGLLQVELRNKRGSLDRFLERWDIPRERAAAVGNSFVDVSMFQGCACSIAFNPVDREVVEGARKVVKSDDLRSILPYLLL